MMKPCLREAIHRFFDWKCVVLTDSPSNASLRTVLLTPLPLDDFTLHICSAIFSSILRTLQCSAPVQFELWNDSKFCLTLEPASAPFELLPWTLSHLSAEYESVASEAHHSQECSVALLANVENFPDRTVSLLHFENNAYRHKTPYATSKLFASFEASGALRDTAISITNSADEESSHQLAVYGNSQYPLIPSAQSSFSYLHHDNECLMRNVVIVLFTSFRRSSADIPNLITNCLFTCSKDLQKKCPAFFLRAPERTMPIIQNIAPSTPSKPTTKRNAAPRRLATHSKVKSPQRKDEDLESDDQNAQTLPPPSRSTDNPFAIASSNTIKPSKSKGKAASSSASPSSSASKAKVPASSQAAPIPPSQPLNTPSANRQAKRKRATPLRDEESTAQETELYVSSIIDSISSIVTTSANPDFVAACFATLGISTSPNVSDLDTSAERRMTEFRRILERNLRASVDLSQKHRRAVTRASGKTERAMALEELVEDEEMDWIEELSEAEIAELWTPAPAMPSDAEWHEMLWSPCTLTDLDEATFELVVM